MTLRPIPENTDAAALHCFVMQSDAQLKAAGIDPASVNAAFQSRTKEVMQYRHGRA